MTESKSLDLGRVIARSRVGVIRELKTDFGCPTVLKLVTQAEGIDNLLEIDVLTRLRHPNLVPGFQVYAPPNGDKVIPQNGIGLVLPQATESLHEYLRRCPLVGPGMRQQRLDYFRQICRGVRFLHRNGIAHLDLKPENILVTGDKIWVADFDASMLVDPDGWAELDWPVVTVTHRPPENLSGSPHHGYPTDVWALGLLALELFGQCRYGDLPHPNGYLALIRAYRELPDRRPTNDKERLHLRDIRAEIADSMGIKGFTPSLEDLLAKCGHGSSWSTQEKRLDHIRRLLDLSRGKVTVEPTDHPDDQTTEASKFTDDYLTEKIVELLQIDPHKRPTIDQVCQWFGVGPEPTLSLVTAKDSLTEIDQHDLLGTRPEGRSVGDLKGRSIDQHEAKRTEGWREMQSIDPRIRSIHEDLFVDSQMALSETALLMATKLVTRAQATLDKALNRTERLLLNVVCLWMVAKAYGRPCFGSTLASWTGETFGWGWRVTLDQGWDLEPWSLGEPLKPSSLVVMERLVVQATQGQLFCLE